MRDNPRPKAVSLVHEKIPRGRDLAVGHGAREELVEQALEDEPAEVDLRAGEAGRSAVGAVEFDGAEVEKGGEGGGDGAVEVEEGGVVEVDEEGADHY